MVVRRQRVAFVMVQSVAVGGHARHENVALQVGAAGARGGFHVGRRGAALPVVDVVEDDVEFLPGQRALHRFGIVAVRHDAGDFLAQIVPRPAVQNGDFVAGLQQFLHQRPADEQRSSDNQDLLLARLLTL